jgi:hypothetical protein
LMNVLVDPENRKVLFELGVAHPTSDFHMPPTTEEEA